LKFDKDFGKGTQTFKEMLPLKAQTTNRQKQKTKIEISCST